MKWFIDGQETYIQDNFLSFGTRVAPFIFSRISDSIVRHLHQLGVSAVNYLDDFIVFGHDWESCRAAQLTLHTVLRSLGFDRAYKKVVSPSNVVTYLGVEVDSLRMELGLPQSKLDKLANELEFFSHRKRATLKQLQRLAGILSHCSALVRGGRTFSHRVISLLKCFKFGNRYVTLGDGFHHDLDWWKQFSSWFNGVSPMIGDMLSEECTFSFDSSFQGYGAVFDKDWLCGSWDGGLTSPLDCQDHIIEERPPISVANINVLELFPVYISILRWGSTWRNSRVVCKSDNTQVVWALNKGRSVNDVSMALLRRIFWLSVIMNFHLVAQHISGDENTWPDSLSRLCTAPARIPLPDHMCCFRAPTDTRGSGSAG